MMMKTVSLNVNIAYAPLTLVHDLRVICRDVMSSLALFLADWLMMRLLKR